MSYFICRRAFRDAKGPVSTGSVIDPVEIKRFRFRLQEGHIVEVTEQNFEQYATLFEQRYGITIPTLDELPLVESDEENAEVDTEEIAEVDTEENAEVDTEENAEVDTEENAEVDTEERAEVDTEENAEVDTEERAEVDTEERAEVDTEEKAEVEESPKAKAKPTVAKATAKAKVTENK